MAVIKLCIFTMRSSVQKFKNYKKVIGIYSSSRFEHFFDPWIHIYAICFCFYWFCKLAVNISICDINWLACSLQMFCVLVSSSISVRRQSTSVLYLVQGWQNVLSVSFVTCIKSLGSLFRCLKNSSNCKSYSFTRTGPSCNFLKAWNSNMLQRILAFSKGMLISLGLN